MTNKTFIYTIILLLFFSGCNNPDEDDILPDGFHQRILDNYIIISMAFDNNGNAWIGTFGQGLIKYNESSTTVYNSENSNLSDTTMITDIAFDSKGNVWMGSDEGLIKFDGSNFTIYNTRNSDIPEDVASSISIDSKDHIWFASCRFQEGGFVKYDGINWEVFTPDNSNLPASMVRSIAVDHNDNIWLAVSEITKECNLIKIANDDWTIYTSDDLGFIPYYFGNIQINSKNEVCGAIDYSLWWQIENTGPQVFIFDGQNSKLLQYNNTSDIRFISLDKDDNIWCSAQQEFCIYNGQDWIIDNQSLNQEDIITIRQAPDNKIWFGTGRGIYIKKAEPSY